MVSNGRKLGLTLAKNLGKQFFTGQLDLSTVAMPIELNICKT